MILILLALIVPTTADPEYYAVKIISGRYKIFSKIRECTGRTGSVYQSGDNRVLFQDDVWKIGTLGNDLDCNTLSSDVEEEYRTKYKTLKPSDKPWFRMMRSPNTGQYKYFPIKIYFRKFFERVEVTSEFNLVGGIKVDAELKEDCLRKEWGKKYPNKDIVVAYQDSNCWYEFVDQAELEYDWDVEYDYDNHITLLFHPAGNTDLRLI